MQHGCQTGSKNTSLNTCHSPGFFESNHHCTAPFPRTSPSILPHVITCFYWDPFHVTKSSEDSSTLLTISLPLSALKLLLLFPWEQKPSKGKEWDKLWVPGLALKPTYSCWVSDKKINFSLQSECQNSRVTYEIGSFPSFRQKQFTSSSPSRLPPYRPSYGTDTKQCGLCYCSWLVSLHFHSVWSIKYSPWVLSYIWCKVYIIPLAAITWHCK